MCALKPELQRGSSAQLAVIVQFQRNAHKHLKPEDPWKVWDTFMTHIDEKATGSELKKILFVFY